MGEEGEEMGEEGEEMVGDGEEKRAQGEEMESRQPHFSEGLSPVWPCGLSSQTAWHHQDETGSCRNAGYCHLASDEMWRRPSGSRYWASAGSRTAPV